MNVIALVDTGAMDSFIDVGFAESNQLQLRLKEVPQKIFGFDGMSGGGVTKEWNGVLNIVDVEGKKNDLKATLGVTKLSGGHNIILGLPWMEENELSLMMNRSGRWLDIGGCVVSAVVVEEEIELDVVS